MNSYVMYHSHSYYSLLDSTTPPKKYVELAVENNQRALSISEHGRPLNWTCKYQACKTAGIKYIHSVEIYLTESLKEQVRDNYHTVLIAKNYEGLKEINMLMELSSRDDHFYYVPRITFDEFLNLSDNIITTSACLASPLNKLNLDHPMFEKLVNKYDFLEIQYHNHPEQIGFNRRLLNLSKQYNKPLIAGTDTHSATPYDAECRKLFLAAKGKDYGDEDSFDLTYKTYDQLVEAFNIQGALSANDYLQAIDNTNMLLDLCEDIEIDTSIKYPILYGNRETDSEKFVETVDRKFKEKIDKGIIPQEQKEPFEKAIQEEMRVFKKLNMDGFMLSMSELISWCKENDITIGPARGSVGGSRIAYVSDIIDLNPERWNTNFARFANEDRVSVADIDVDCIESERPKIFEYITNRFGTRKTARVASFGTLKDKDVIDTVARQLARNWQNEHPDKFNNPWSKDKAVEIKEEYDKDPEETKKKYPELFYYFDGLLNCKKSQSIHPAGMVISPITLDDNCGVFHKDGDLCLLLDMDEVHDIGLVKYDFLVLKTIEKLRDCCNYIGIPFPKSHEMNWDDPKVWDDMITKGEGLFQFEANPGSFRGMQRFKPRSISDMAIVTACIRPSGESYREDLLDRLPNKNPSKLIDNLLADNLGYLIYQEDIIQFLQEICGFSGSAADNVRRGIASKRKEILDEAMPKILDGYCEKSDQPREVAEDEAKAFLKIIEDSSSYMFNRNHAIAYCMITYLCAYYRYYYPIEFVTSYLNNAENDEDVKRGSLLADKLKIKITMPKFGYARAHYNFDKENNIISKGVSSIKYLSDSVAEELYDLSLERDYESFVDLLMYLQETSIDTRQLDLLIKIDYFSEFGTQSQLLKITNLFYNLFKRGEAKQIAKKKVDGTELEPLFKEYACGTTKDGKESKNYAQLDILAIMRGAEDIIKSTVLTDLDIITKARNFIDIMGYAGYVTGKQEDRNKLYVQAMWPWHRRLDNKLIGQTIVTKSLGSGIESHFSIPRDIFMCEPIKKGDFIVCKRYEQNGKYFNMLKYEKMY